MWQASRSLSLIDARLDIEGDLLDAAHGDMSQCVVIGQPPHTIPL